MIEILELIEQSQIDYINSTDKNYLKTHSQIFTPQEIAKKMIDSIDIEFLNSKSEITILEPAAGCGLLIFSIINHLLKNTNIKTIIIDAFENDINVYNILKVNMKNLKNKITSIYPIKLKINIYNDNFITFNSKNWQNKKSYKYDLIISNPPYKKINQTSTESVLMKSIIFGQPNIYLLFIAMSLKLLKPNGQYVVLSPRNYLNGTYSYKLREYIFNNFSLTKIYYFDKRNIFDSVNQEVIISTFISSKSDNKIHISTSEGFNFELSFKDLIYNDKLLSIIIPRTSNDLALLKKLLAFNCTLESLNIKVSVGPIVQFRNLDDLSAENYNKNYAPLLIGRDIQENNIILYNDRKKTRKTHNKSLKSNNRKLISNSNYLIVRKVTAKDDRKLITCAVLEKNYFNHAKLALDNNLLYFSNLDNSEMSLALCYGLYCFINSDQFQSLYYMINGTHTINVSDINSIKFPDINVLIELGNNIYNSNHFTSIYCTNLLNLLLKK